MLVDAAAAAAAPAGKAAPAMEIDSKQQGGLHIPSVSEVQACMDTRSDEVDRKVQQ